MSTRFLFHASCLNKGWTCNRSAYVLFLRMIAIFYDFFITVNAFKNLLVSLVLITSSTKMIRLAMAFWAKIIWAFPAPYSIETHMDSSLVWYLIAIVVLSMEVYFTLLHLHNGATWALSKIRIWLHEFIELFILNILQVFFTKMFPYLTVSYYLITNRARKFS